ncbi:MAG: NADH-quinone oxidoreductase subunit C [Lentisphaeria bacterium]
MADAFLQLTNPGSALLADLPVLPFVEFSRQALSAIHERGGRVSAFFAIPQANNFRLILVLALDAEGNLLLSACDVEREYPSLTPECTQFHWFEREIAEQYGIKPLGHPWLKPIRFNHSEEGEERAPGVTEYFAMQGEAAHEVAVGPVHAGVIEPGHFRFQCLGEDVFSLEISLGYQHRGIEKMLQGGPDNKSIHLLETASGDSSCASAGAFCQLLETLTPGGLISDRDQALRVVAWELERIANHAGDLGALAGDVAFRPTAGYCGRIRGDFLNMTAALCGNRFGRGLIVPGGMGYEVDLAICNKLLPWLKKTANELDSALDLLFDAPSVLDRFENTGTVSSESASQAGLVGVAARASALAQDVRSKHPYGWYCQHKIPMPLAKSGDVLARAWVRRQELAASVQIVQELLENLPLPGKKPVPYRLAGERIVVSLVEAWRGELCHVALTDASGKFSSYKIVDPSFHNWFGLALSLRGEQISHFPLCNKSFNLSYCGHDL